MTSEKKVGYHPGGSVPRKGRTTSRQRFNSLTPLQRASIAQTQRARATTGKPTSAQKKINNTNMQKVKQLSAPQKQMPRTTSRVGSTAARRRAAAIARRKAQAATPQNAANAAMARRTNAKYGRRKPTGRTVYNSRTTIPTRPTARRTAKPARGRVGQSLNRYMQARRTNAKLGRPTGRTVAGRFKKTPGAAIPKRSTATSGKRSRDYSLGRRRFT